MYNHIKFFLFTITQQVLRYCFFLWLSLGNSKFEKLRDVLVLPSKRTLQLFKSNVPQGDGYRQTVFNELGKLWGIKAKEVKDWDCILSWDATGYAKTMSFNKYTGVLEGFSYDPESFSMHQLFSNKVNCFLVSSPEINNNIRFPIAYYHTTSLNSAIIRQQWSEVMTGLDSIGLRVISCVCDGASEHAKFFNLILESTSIYDPSIAIRLRQMWVVSDPPHLIKKFRNNWLSSGDNDFHTKRLEIDGNHIGWSVMDGTRTVSTTLPDGTQRCFQSLPKLNYDVVHPSSIQKLRVSLAAIPFSVSVQQFVRDNIDRVATEAKVNVNDVKATLKFSDRVNELFRIMNSREPITWSDENDQDGVPIGFRDKCDTTHGFNLNWFSEKYGVSVDSMKKFSGLPSGESVPALGSSLLIDRPKVLLEVADYFKSWKTSVNNLNGYTKTQRSKMFITHWLYDDLRRTCYSMVELLHHYVKGTDRVWILRRFTQDPIESLFGQIRSLNGSNTNLDRIGVDHGFSEIRSKLLKKLIMKQK